MKHIEKLKGEQNTNREHLFSFAHTALHRQIGQNVHSCLIFWIELLQKMYNNVPTYLHPAAARSVLAHIIWLVEKGKVTCTEQPGLNTKYRLGVR